MKPFASGLIAQSVEQLPFKQLVLGSSPSQPTMARLFPLETRFSPKFVNLS